MKPLPINDKAADDLRTITSISDGDLNLLLRELRKDVRFFHSKELLKLFQKHAGQEAGKTLLSHVASLNLLRDEDGESGERVFERLHEGIVERSDAELEQSFVKRKTVLVDFFEDETVYLSAKGARLFAVDTLHLHGFKAYCDVRPIFGPHRKNIHAFLLYATVHIIGSDYHEDEQMMSVALREKDLQDIIKECTTALEKLKAAERELSVNKDIGIVRYGSEQSV